jgi:cell division protein FtsB
MNKNIIALSLCGIALACGLGYIVFGHRGIIAYYKLYQEIELENKQIQELENKISHIQAKIDSWKSDDFNLEKFARQNLQMGKPGEQVYVLTNTNK